MKIRKVISNKWFILCCTLAVGLIFYLQRITYSALWYDEAVEYFYSKILIGEVPGGFSTKDMYERICITYQPPLYNVLMYVWLMLFDGEFAFRLAGIIITLIGTCGIFLSVDKVAGYRWGMLGAFIYMFTPSVSQYAVECAEYNLVLCCLSWTGYFLICYVTEHKNSSLNGFLICACCSVYSQYGAAFMVFVMWLALLLHVARMKNRKLTNSFLIRSFIIIIIAAIPLFIFFLIPQLEHQGTLQTSHTMILTEANIVVDYIKAFLSQINFLFRIHSKGIINIPFMAMIFCSCIFVFLKLCKDRKNIVIFLTLVCFFSWTCYYLAVICSFYAYNDWGGNARFGNKYGLFLTPLFVITIVYGLFAGQKLIFELRSQSWVKPAMRALIALLAVAYCSVGVYIYYNAGAKDDIREITEIWYENEGYNSNTVVQQWSDANFQFYLIHNKNYLQQYQKNIIVLNRDMEMIEYTGVDDMIDSTEISAMGLMYISPVNESYENVRQWFIDNGYQVETLFKGNSALLYVK